jgi:hypothetical protein
MFAVEAMYENGQVRFKSLVPINEVRVPRTENFGCSSISFHSFHEFF